MKRLRTNQVWLRNTPVANIEVDLMALINKHTCSAVPNKPGQTLTSWYRLPDTSGLVNAVALIALGLGACMGSALVGLLVSRVLATGELPMRPSASAGLADRTPGLRAAAVVGFTFLPRKAERVTSLSLSASNQPTVGH